MNDLALFRLKLSIGSLAPAYVLLSYVSPALLADGQFFTFHHYV
jgi:hypothetical protein